MSLRTGQVVDQVRHEAKNPGLETVDAAEPVFLSGEAICVTTMQTLVNGKSRFGLVGVSNRQPVKVGTIESPRV